MLRNKLCKWTPISGGKGDAKTGPTRMGIDKYTGDTIVFHVIFQSMVPIYVAIPRKGTIMKWGCTKGGIALKRGAGVPQGPCWNSATDGNN